MRLNEQQKKAIRQTAREVFGNEAQVYLFGSRVNDDKKGGDIDLLIKPVSSGEENLTKKLLFSARLKSRIGEQRIDVVLDDGESKRLIILEARKNGVKL